MTESKPPPKGVYLGHPRSRIKATADLLRYYRKFIRDEGPATHARIPLDPWRGEMTREEAQIRLSGMVNEAINRKAGLRPRGRKDDLDYQARLLRDQDRIRKRIKERVIVQQFETEEVRRRFSHLLTSPDDF